MGTLAECVELIGPELVFHATLLLEIFLPLAKDEEAEVRNNAIFGLGELVLHSKQALYSYPFFLKK